MAHVIWLWVAVFASAARIKMVALTPYEKSQNYYKSNHSRPFAARYKEICVDMVCLMTWMISAVVTLMPDTMHNCLMDCPLIYMAVISYVVWLHTLMVAILSICSEIALQWVPQDFTDTSSCVFVRYQSFDYYFSLYIFCSEVAFLYQVTCTALSHRRSFNPLSFTLV